VIIKRISEKPVVLGFLLFFILATVSLLTTNQTSRIVIESVRVLAIVATAGVMLYLAVTRGVSIRHFFSIFIYVLFLALGAFLSIVSTGKPTVDKHAVDLVVVSSGLFIISYIRGEELDYKMARGVLSYAVVAMILLVSLGGLSLEFPPRFIFDYMSSGVAYSQGVSRFFGYGAIAAAVLMTSGEIAARWKIMLGMLVAVFLSLSLLGGARGDSIFALVVVFIYLCIVFKLRFLLFAGAAAAMASVMTLDFVQELVIFQRISSLNQSFGHRDVLLIDAWELLSQETVCMVIGCGFNYFQYFYGYPDGMYPHNVIVEMVIVFGIPVCILFILLAVRGGGVFLRERSRSPFLMLIFIYSLFVALKSGSVINSWVFMVFLMYFMSLGLSSFISRKVQSPNEVRGFNI